jgi:NAD(P)-dependent dehydrogenase (short-subunit alcohol dehydrogenase family)
MSRVTLVTGAGQGIGKDIALAFASQGDSLVLAARNEANLEATAAIARERGVEALVVPTDLSKPEDVDRLTRVALERFGGVDVIVNNSGIGGSSGVLWETDLADWQQTLDVNVTGVFLICRALLPHMVERGSGSVIIIGSISGKRPLWGRTPYTTSKAALVGLTRTLALETGAHGIRANLISPGFVAGPRLDWVIDAQAEGRGISPETVRAEFEAESPLFRLTKSGDIADACVFLASDAAAAITGVDLNVNSGVVMY